MSRTYNLDARLGAPTPRHALTAGAEAARRAVRRFARKRNLDRQIDALITKHGRPGAHGMPIPVSAERFRLVAQGKGFEVWVGVGHWRMNAGKSNERSAPAWIVAGANRVERVGFRAIWADGKAMSGEWWRAPGLPAEHVGIAEVTARVKGMP